MKTFLLSKNEQGIVVFKFFPSLEYSNRMLLSFGLIISGIAVQIVYYNLFAGILFILGGSLLQVVSGYDNRIKTGRYRPDADWIKFNKGKLDEILQFDKKMKSWDRSAIDISNGLGSFVFVFIIATLVIIFMTGINTANTALIIISVDAAVLLIPHWVTGIREILHTPKLIIKIKLIKDLIADVKNLISDNQIDYFLLLKGKKIKIPDDVKIRVAFKNQPKDFLGFYGQVVTNTVQGHDYPYFYVVLVAKKGFGLLKHYKKYDSPDDVVTSYSEKKDVEVFVVRQDTSLVKGYYTKRADVKYIFEEGYRIAAQICGN